MWDYVINIHPSELLSTKTKKSRINESYIKNKIKKCFTIIFKKLDSLHFTPNNILTKFLKS